MKKWFLEKPARESANRNSPVKLNKYQHLNNIILNKISFSWKAKFANILHGNKTNTLQYHSCTKTWISSINLHLMLINFIKRIGQLIKRDSNLPVYSELLNVKFQFGLWRESISRWSNQIWSPPNFLSWEVEGLGDV